MKTFLLSSLAVAGIFFSLSQKTEAHGYARGFCDRPYYGEFEPYDPDSGPFFGNNFAVGGFRDRNFYGRSFGARRFAPARGFRGGGLHGGGRR